MEIHLNDRIAEVNILEADGSTLKVDVDGRIYELDYAKIGVGTYSFLLGGKTIELEVIKTKQSKFYEVKHHCFNFDAEVVDAESKYKKHRKQSEIDDGERTISSPMPGKVISIDVQVGEKVDAGQTLIVISAMKMESEYKAKKEGVVKEILTQVGATIEGNQPLIILE